MGSQSGLGQRRRQHLIEPGATGQTSYEAGQGSRPPQCTSRSRTRLSGRTVCVGCQRCTVLATSADDGRSWRLGRTTEVAARAAGRRSSNRPAGVCQGKTDIQRAWMGWSPARTASTACSRLSSSRAAPLLEAHRRRASGVANPAGRRERGARAGPPGPSACHAQLTSRPPKAPGAATAAVGSANAPAWTGSVAGAIGTQRG